MKQLPSITDLYNTDNIEVYEKQNQLLYLLNQPPKASWIKEHPFVKGLKYIPIERVKWLLNTIFIQHRIEVLDTKIMANSVCVTVRLYVLNPITNEWQYHDGVGAVPLQTDKDSSPVDWNHLKADAVMKALPAAKSFAVKDAAEELGKIFGRDLNNKEDIAYSLLLNRVSEDINHELELKTELESLTYDEIRAKSNEIKDKYLKLGVKKYVIENIICKTLENKRGSNESLSNK